MSIGSQQRRSNGHIILSIGAVFESYAGNVSTKFRRQMIPIAYKHAQFVNFEGLECVEDLADKLRLDVFKIVDGKLFRFNFFAVADEGLSTLQCL